MEFHGGHILKIGGVERVVGGRAANAERYVTLMGHDPDEVPDYMLAQVAQVDKPLNYIVRKEYEEMYVDLMTADQFSATLPTIDFEALEGAKDIHEREKRVVEQMDRITNRSSYTQQRKRCSPRQYCNA